MSAKNFVSYGDAETLFAGISDKLKTKGVPRKEIILIGDSYGVDLVNHWDSWQTIFATNNPQWTVHKMSTGGAGFSIAAEGRNFLQTLQYLETQEEIDGNMVTNIVVLGGYNDMSATISFGGIDGITTYILPYIQAFVQYCKVNYPYAKITIGCIGFDYNSSSNNNRCEMVNQAYEQCAVRCGIDYYRKFRFILLQKSFIYFHETDANSGFHPNTAGNTEVARMLERYISIGKFTVRKGIIQNGAQVYVEDGNVTIMPNTYEQLITYFAGPNLVSKNTIPFNSWTEICDLGNNDGDNLLWGAQNGYPCFIVTVTGSDGTKPLDKICTVLLKIQNKKLYGYVGDNVSGMNLTAETCQLDPVGPLYFDYQVMY